MSKKIILGSIGVFGAVIMFLGATRADAASFEKMKEDVNNNTGIVYNPELAREMTKEETLKYISIIEAEQKDQKSSGVTPKIQEKALRTVIFDKDSIGENVIVSKVEDSLSELTRGTSIPTNKYTLTGKTYTSSEFSGSGCKCFWRFLLF